MKRGVPILAAFAITACSSTTSPVTSEQQEYPILEKRALENIMCIFENQTRCDHIIENRTIFARFFAPADLGGLTANQKINGRRVTTKFVVEAAASIQQCQRTSTETISLIKDVKISGGTYRVEGTKPLEQGQSVCFIAPEPTEGS
ncbi:MAG: hypothetical protein AAGF54_14085 [Pseudomonadota bacterium]